MSETTPPLHAVNTEYLPPELTRLGRWRRSSWHFTRTQPFGAAGLAVIAVMTALAVFAPLIAQHDPTDFSRDILAEPSSDHFFGTTRQGRDIFSRVLYGGRVSLGIGLSTVIVSLLGGTLLGLIAGYLKGPADLLLSRAAEVIISLPAIIFALVLATALGKGISTLIIAISVIFTPPIFRIMRGAVLQESAQQYVEAARVVGASQMRIILRHLLPNLAGLMIITASATLPAAILTEAGLSFLGVGVKVAEPSWGGDLGGQARQFFVQAWWIAVFPGLALSLTVLAFNLLGDSLRDVMDPRLRGSGLQ